MKKEKKTIKVGKLTFAENNKLNIVGNFKSLDQCYNNCSTTKRGIYYSIINELNDKNFSLENYGVASYNCNFFTFEAIARSEGKAYYLYITYAHNYFMEIC